MRSAEPIDRVDLRKHDALRVGDLVLFAGCVLVVTERRPDGDWAGYHANNGRAPEILSRGLGPKEWRVIGHVAEVAEAKRLDALINNPHTNDFLEGVRTEAAHQRERWGSEHDAGKSAPDWFWLLGHLAGKALAAWKSNDRPKLLHHIITAAAALLNWHAHETGESTSMRPGIEPPESEADDAP